MQDVYAPLVANAVRVAQKLELSVMAYFTSRR